MIESSTDENTTNSDSENDDIILEKPKRKTNYF